MSEQNYGKGAFLTIVDIKERVRELFPEHYERVLTDICGQPPWTDILDDHKYKASYDLHLGNEVAKSTSKSPISLAKNNGVITIEPGEFALLHTLEKIHVPLDLMALISLRFSVKKKGLINISGFHVDPGYDDYLVFSVYNAGSRPICLRYGEAIFMIFYATLTRDALIGYGRGPGETFKSEDIENLKGPALTLINLNDRLDKAEAQLKILIGLFIATLGSAIIAIITALHY